MPDPPPRHPTPNALRCQGRPARMCLSFHLLSSRLAPSPLIAYNYAQPRNHPMMEGYHPHVFIRLQWNMMTWQTSPCVASLSVCSPHRLALSPTIGYTPMPQSSPAFSSFPNIMRCCGRLARSSWWRCRPSRPSSPSPSERYSYAG